MSHGWGRTQKYRARTRHLYALLFENGCAYIGQTVDPKGREQQHRRPTGGWGGKPFKCVALGTCEGTEDDAKDLEHAWRHKASLNGWTIYGKPPGMIVDHQNQMNRHRYKLASTLKWPIEQSRNRLTNWMKAAIVAAASVLLALVLL